MVRRKAPPPPKKTVIAAKALYDFEPDDNEEEMAFKEGDDIEIIEKTAALEEEGWCRARIKGSKKSGLAPLEYLEIIVAPVQTPGPPKPLAAAPISIPGSGFVPPQASEPSQNAATAQGIPLPSSQHPNPLSMQKLSAPGQTGPIEVKNKIGKWEVAGLSLAGIGATAGVAAVMQTAKESAATHTKAEVVHSQQIPAEDQSQISTSNSNDSDNSNPALQSSQPSTSQDQPPPQDQMPSNDQTTPGTPPQPPASEQTPAATDNEAMASTSPTETTITSTDYYDDSTLPPPATDLSAFSGGFEPLATINEVNPVADLAAVDPVYASINPAVASAPDLQTSPDAQAAVTATANSNAVEYFGPISPFASIATPPPEDTGLDMGVQDPDVLVSPFASLATQPSTTMTTTTAGVVNQDVSNVNSVTEVSNVDEGGGADWQVDLVDDNTFYDLE